MYISEYVVFIWRFKLEIAVFFNECNFFTNEGNTKSFSFERAHAWCIFCSYHHWNSSFKAVQISDCQKKDIRKNWRNLKKKKNKIKATSSSWEGFIPNTASSFCPFFWYLRHFATGGQIYHSTIVKGLRICIIMMSVGLINPFQKFREVFICSVEFLKFCSKLLLWFPLSKPCQEALLVVL